MRKFPLLIIAVAAIGLSGCQTIAVGPGAGGQIKPGTAPAPIANQGIIGGGLVGGDFGKPLSPKDKVLALNAEYKALEYAGGGELVSWAGADGKFAGTVVAAQPYRVGSQDCRQYSHEITTAGTITKARGSACRNPDGTWSLLN